MSKEKIEIKIGNIEIISSDPGNDSKVILMIVLLGLLIFTTIVCFTMKSWAGTILLPVLGHRPIAGMLRMVRRKKIDP